MCIYIWLIMHWTYYKRRPGERSESAEGHGDGHGHAEEARRMVFSFVSGN